MNDEIKILVAKYIVGEASEEEAATVKQWIRMSKENEAYYVQLYETWHISLSAEPHLIDARKAHKAFISRITDKKRAYRYILNWPRIASAAIIILACTIGYLYFRPFDRAETWHKISVSEGLPRKLILADNTVVWVNAGSHIRYSTNFGKSSRTIYLDGEAYFDVAESKNNIPFIVKAKNLTIRDIGTAFNVKAYADDPLFEATVVEGKISVEGKLSKHDEENSKVFLKKKQVLKINAQTDKIRENKSAPERIKVLAIEDSQIELYNGWKDDFLVFDGASFMELAKIIERRYAVEVVFKDEALKVYKYSGSFRNVDQITSVMNIIKATTAIDYKITGHTVVITETNIK